MKAAIMEQWGEILLKDIPKPEIKDHEALVLVKYGGICGTDLHVFHGQHPTARVPLVMGHEFSGEIAQIKDGTGFKPGDKVAVQPYYGCGVCEACLLGRDNICKHLKLAGVHENGCFAEYVKVPVKKIYKLSDDTDLKLAALLEPLAVGIHDVRSSGLQVGQRALVLGGGPIGLFIAMVARLSGAEVFIAEVNQYRIDFIKSLGYTAANPMGDGYKAQLQDFTKGKGFDVVFEVTGVESVLLQATAECKIGGTLVFVGMPGKPLKFNVMEAIMKELKMRGVRIHSQVNFAAAVEILEKGSLNAELEKMATHVFKLDDFDKALDFSFKDEQHYKVLIEI